MEYLWGYRAIAEYLGIDRQTALRLLSTGKLPARKIGGRWAADPAELAPFRSEASA